MSAAGPKLRRGRGRYFHWCPGCREMHALPDGWTFDGDVARPTFSPSFRHDRGDRGGPCHYFITVGRIEYCGDSHHALAGQTVDLPDIPAGEVED